MKRKSFLTILLLLLIVISGIYCGKGGSGGTTPPPPPPPPPPSACTGVTITVSGTTTANTSACAPTYNGTVNVTASGGTGTYTYSIASGTFQSGASFGTLNGGSYTITARDGNGCTGSATVTVANVAAGPLFSAVKTLVQNNCAISGCHGNTQTPLLNTDCAIVTNKEVIKSRAVDGIPSPMPASGLLPATERAKITNWINAGGQFTN